MKKNMERFFKGILTRLYIDKDTHECKSLSRIILKEDFAIGRPYPFRKANSSGRV